MSSDDSIRFAEAPPGHLGSIRAVVTERTGGVSSGAFASLNLGRFVPDEPAQVAINERRVAEALRVDPASIARIRLEHGSRVVSAATGGDQGIADALVALRKMGNDTNVVLTLTVADCFPVAFAGPHGFALAHCGWRGVHAGVIEATVQALAFGKPDLLSAWIGPGIEAACYPVGPEVAQFFPGSIGEWREASIHLDLAAEIRTRLSRIGLSIERIAHAGLCTACHPDRFFSHRRDGFPAGRMAAFVWDPAHLDPSRTGTGSPRSSI